MRAHVEQAIGLIAEGKARKDDVVAATLEQFKVRTARRSSAAATRTHARRARAATPAHCAHACVAAAAPAALHVLALHVGRSCDDACACTGAALPQM